MPQPTDILVFTYGTLRKGRSNHFMLRDADFIGSDAIHAKYVDTGYSFPGIVEGNDQILGEVYRVSEQLLQRLDHLEGVEVGFYTRRLTRTELGRTVNVYYFGSSYADSSPST